MGNDMKKTLLLASFLILAGTVHGQALGSPAAILNGAGSMNNAGGSLGSGGGLNGAGSINVPLRPQRRRMPQLPWRSGGPQRESEFEKPGEYVPSRFSNYGDAVALGVVESGIRPLTVAEAARMAQTQKKNAEQKRVIVLDRNANGNW